MCHCRDLCDIIADDALSHSELTAKDLLFSAYSLANRFEPALLRDVRLPFKTENLQTDAIAMESGAPYW